MSRILKLAGYKYFARHPLQAALSVLGVALGVALIVSIDIANASSGEAFKLSMESITGKATHKISNSMNGIPDSIYIKLKLKGKYTIAPIVENYVRGGKDFSGTFILMGIDYFSEKPFRDYLVGGGGKYKGNPLDIISKPNTIVISDRLAAKLKLGIGDSLQVRFGGSIHTLKIAAVFSPGDRKNTGALDMLLITDISTAQTVLNMKGLLSGIDLIASGKNKGAVIREIQSELPEGVEVRETAGTNSVNKGMTEAFNTNLRAMSLLALIVGMFLIYNTMTFSVLQRRTDIGLLRSIGVTRNEIFTQVILESGFLGAAGTLIGIILGIVLGDVMLGLVSRTINDLYYVVRVREVRISDFTIIKGALIGLAATILAALKPAVEATKSPVRVVLRRSSIELNITRNLKKYAAAGIVFIILGAVVLLLPDKDIVLSYAGIAPLIFGFSLLSPAAIMILDKIFRPLVKKVFGYVGNIAAGSVVANMSRSSIAVAALAIAISATIGVGTMISSFRGTVVTWLEKRLSADIYVSAPSMVSRFNDQPFDPAIANKISKLPEVEYMNRYREFRIITDKGIIHMLAADLYKINFNTFVTKEKGDNKLWDEFRHSDVVFVSEPFSFHNNVDVGDTITIPTDKGEKKFRIAGIYYDYSSDIGLVLISYRTYSKYWNDRLLSGLAVFLKNKTDLDKTMKKISSLADKNQDMVIRSNLKLLNNSIKVFDRTFIVTNVLQLLAIIVAFVGILSSLMALLIERKKEIGVYRAIGFTPGQVSKMVFIQTGIIGFAAGILALPLGNILAMVLTFIINKRSFGWSLQFEVLPGLMLEALVLSVVAALLAGIYPVIKMGRISPANAIREE